MYHLLFLIVAAEDGYSMSVRRGTLFLLAEFAAIGTIQESPLTVVPRIAAVAGIAAVFGYYHAGGMIATGDIVVAAVLVLRMGVYRGLAAIGVGAAVTLVAVYLLGWRRDTVTIVDHVPALPGFLCGELIVEGFGSL